MNRLDRWPSIASLCLVLCGCQAVPVSEMGSGMGTDAAKPLECMQRFQCREFVIGAWAWPDARPSPDFFDEEYCRRYKEAGFNVILYAFPNWLGTKCPPISFDEPMRLAEKVGLGVVIHTVTLDAEPWGDVEIPAEKYREITDGHYARLPELQWLHARYGNSPALAGYLLNDNCGLHDYTVECANWLLTNAPGVFPWMSTNPDPEGQAKVPMPMLSTQVYPFSYHHGAPEKHNRLSFCNVLERDRHQANRSNMALWPIVATFSSTESPSQLRFQAFTSIAYGAQAVWYFSYTRYFRAVLYDAAQECHAYIGSAVGPRVLGHRSIGVFHAGSEIPKGALIPGPGKLLESMNSNLLVGVLVTEQQFKAGNPEPDYLIVVDTRTSRVAEPERTWWREWNKTSPRLPEDVVAARPMVESVLKQELPAQQWEIRFGPAVKKVEAFLPGGEEQGVQPWEPTGDSSAETEAGRRGLAESELAEWRTLKVCY